MTLRMAAGIALMFLILAGPVLAAEPKATLESASGEILLGDGADAVVLEPGKPLPKGMPLNLGKGAKATVVFEDGSRMNLVGPARVTIQEMQPGFRRVDLSKGRITSFSVGNTITGVHTPEDAFAALSNGTIGVHVQDGGATFNLFDGEDAKVVDVGADQVVELTPNSPYVVGEPAEDAPQVSVGKETGPGTKDVRRLRVGNRLIVLSPKNGFDVTSTDTGGTKLTCTVPEGEFGTVQLGITTVFYLAGGQTVVLDSAGNVTSSEGVGHTRYQFLDVREIYDQAFSPPGDSSPIHVR